ncbi:MAG: ABC transporter ATP-binding protein [Polyangiaceae bacterium]|nr:ABC transporter ATP-binding protein [Polyangiaceae bacterium]
MGSLLKVVAGSDWSFDLSSPDELTVAIAEAAAAVLMRPRTMALQFNKISHSYGENEVLRELDFGVEAGKITCLLGPSGGGKSTLLRLAAGLEPLTAGTIDLDGQEIASPKRALPPEQRPVGMMFQENALFPHLSVAENVAFGLKGWSSAKKAARIEELLQMVDLSEYGQRRPHQLSGGQQQRVALIRSLAPQPRVLLMDEPYASIDVTLRRNLREAARRTIKKSGITAIMVTHDPAEAMEMADIIAVLDAGRILQVGTPEDVYQSPSAAAVAALFGESQCIPAEQTSSGFQTPYGFISCPSLADDATRSVDLVLRPGGVRVVADDSSQLKVTDRRFIGGTALAFLENMAEPGFAQPLRVAVDHQSPLNIGDAARLEAAEEGFFVFERTF